MELRGYQRECIDTIIKQPPGAYVVQMATGLGKTVTFANIPRSGRMLILSHREELVEQPRKYFSCSYGVERAKYHSNGEEVISASIQTMVKRMERYSPTDFEYVIVDEAHHSAARTYRNILSYFRPDKLLGFSATPSRKDGARLDDIYSDIIFSRDLRWGIQNGYLCDIYCLRVNIGYDLSRVRTVNGDYAPGELDEAMQGTADAIAEAYQKYAKGATLIFAVSVKHAEDIAKRIPGAVVVTGKTKDRASIKDAFTRGDIPCIVNCMVFTEGTDVPRVETVIMARPTQSDSLYQQATGRGLRLYPGKDKLTLIDCVGVTGKASLCTAPSLLGIDLDGIPEDRLEKVQGELFELPEKAEIAADCPQSWIKNVRIVDLWAKEQKYNTHDMALFKQPDGSFTISLKGRKMKIPCPDMLGRVTFPNGRMVPMQEALDQLYKVLNRDYLDQEYIWNRRKVKKWEGQEASESQKRLVSRLVKGYDVENMTKGQASLILNRLIK